MTPVPSLDTDRLTLRGHLLDDLSECVALWSDPVVTRYIGGRPFTREEIWHRLLRYAGHWALLGYGFFVVREKSSGRFVGEVGLADSRRDLEPDMTGVPELGYVLAPWAHGRGFASEAVRAVVEWGTTRLPATRTFCMINPENLASIRVAEKAGYREFQRTTYHGGPTILLERRG